MANLLTPGSLLYDSITEGNHVAEFVATIPAVARTGKDNLERGEAKALAKKVAVVRAKADRGSVACYAAIPTG